MFQNQITNITNNTQLTCIFQQLPLRLNVPTVVVSAYVVLLHALDRAPSFILLPLREHNLSHQPSANHPFHIELGKRATRSYVHIFRQPTVLASLFSLASCVPPGPCLRKRVVCADFLDRSSKLPLDRGLEQCRGGAGFSGNGTHRFS